MRKLIEYQDLGLYTSCSKKKGYIQLLMELSGINKINSIYSSVVVKGGRDGMFASKFLDELNITIKEEVKENFEANLSRPEGHIITPNLPHGAIDAMVVFETCRKYKENTKIVVPKIIAQVEAIKSDIIVYDFEKKNHKSSFEAMLKHLNEGGNLIIFAQKGVSKGFKDTVSLEWKKPMLKLIRELKAPVIPIFIKGGNSLRFQLIRAISKRLAEADSLNQIISKSHASFKLLECQRIEENIITSITKDNEIGLLFNSVFTLSLEREKELLDTPNAPTKNEEPPKKYNFNDTLSQTKKIKPYSEDDERKYYIIDKEFSSEVIVLEKSSGTVSGVAEIKYGDKIIKKKSDNEFSFYQDFEYSHKINKLLEKSIEIVSLNINPNESEILATNTLCEALYELLSLLPNYKNLIASTTIISSYSKLARRLMIHQVKKYTYVDNYKKSFTARLNLYLKPLHFMGGKYKNITERRDILSLFIRYTDEKGSLISTELKRHLQYGGKFIALSKTNKGNLTTIKGLILIKGK